MKDIAGQRVQAIIARKAKSVSPKSVRNLVARLRVMWNQVKACGYVQYGPFWGYQPGAVRVEVKLAPIRLHQKWLLIYRKNKNPFQSGKRE